jgi:hypothetical protein
VFSVLWRRTSIDGIKKVFKHMLKPEELGILSALPIGLGGGGYVDATDGNY